MKATLRTRCGCQREIEIPFPPNLKIIVPVSHPINFSQKAENLLVPFLRTREFELQDYAGGLNGHAEYLERWPDYGK